MMKHAPTSMRSSMRFLFTILILITTCITYTDKAYGEYVFLKNGDIVKGKIRSETYQGVQIIREDGSPSNIPQEDILRILYTDINMGRRLIRLTNGKTFEAFLVNEDHNSYLFRKELHKPDEFKVAREKILFMTMTNPTDLSGRGLEDSVSLSWHSPFKSPGSYRVYLRTDKDKNYLRVGETLRTSFRVRNLNRGTRYFFIVKAVDSHDRESLPSNEIAVVTDRPPPAPYGASCKKMIGKGQKSMSVKIRWKEPRRNRNLLSGYAIYTESDVGLTRIGTSRATEFTVEDLDPDKTHRFVIRSCDDHGNESDDAYVDTERFKMMIGAKAQFIVPYGELKRLMKFGYGGIVTIGFQNIFFNNFIAGVDFGGWTFLSNSEKLKSGYTLPLCARAGYRIILIPSFMIEPAISAGCSYNEYKYIRRYYFFNASHEFQFSINRGYYQKTIDPLLTAGIMLMYHFQELIMLQASIEYGLFPMPGRLFHFNIFSVGLLYRFK